MSLPKPPIEGSANVPIDSLRDNLAAMGSDPVVVYCEVGQRGHTATGRDGPSGDESPGIPDVPTPHHPADSRSARPARLGGGASGDDDPGQNQETSECEATHGGASFQARGRCAAGTGKRYKADVRVVRVPDCIMRPPDPAHKRNKPENCTARSERGRRGELSNGRH
jgi:hypothetical protein